MTTEVDLAKITVLAVDDVEDNLDLLQDMLEGEVWVFVRARSGEEAIRLATEYRPDVVLLDLVMPRMNGLAVVHAFRGTEALRRIPIIVQTAYADRDAVLTAKRLGCHYVLTKPLRRERLFAQIRSCLENRSNGTASAYNSTKSPMMPTFPEDLVPTLRDALNMVECNFTSRDIDNLSQDADQIGGANCLRHLIGDNSPIGQKLIKLANSPAYAARQPARNITEAIVRIGIRETIRLIHNSAETPTNRHSSSRTLKALELLDSLALLFPDRSATSEGMLSLLNELNRTADATVPALCAVVQDEQSPGSPEESGAPS